jgi:hypothetical protein
VAFLFGFGVLEKNPVLALPVYRHNPLVNLVPWHNIPLLKWLFQKQKTAFYFVFIIVLVYIFFIKIYYY